MTEPVFGVENLSVTIGSNHILRDVSFSVGKGETLGIVGESGSGKSLSLLAATGLLSRDAADISGKAFLKFRGEEVDLLTLSPRRLRDFLGKGIGFVFQDPQSSLNPIMTVEQQITETLRYHLGLRGKEATSKAKDLLDLVGIPDPQRRLGAYPHELSGGMRQRVMIAIALSCDPEVLIADEPTTALDVTVQAQILEIVANLQQQLGTAVVWVSHDLGVVAQIADHITVLYAGEVLETGTKDKVFGSPAHPYTSGLIASRARVTKRLDELKAIPGSPPKPSDSRNGCVFYDRCDLRIDARCATEHPPLREVSPGHFTRTFYEVEDE